RRVARSDARDNDAARTASAVAAQGSSRHADRRGARLLHRPPRRRRGRRRYYWKSEWLPRLSPDLFEQFRARAAAIPSPHSAMILFQVGGALNELPNDHSPMGNRDATFVLNIAGSWESAADDAACVGWARSTWESMRRFSTGGVYVNFLTEDEGADRVAAAYGGANLARLAELKKKYDPTGLFRHTKP